MNPGPRTTLPWWASYFRDAMKTWGLALVIVVAMGAFAWVQGDRYLTAKIECDRLTSEANLSDARTFATVAHAIEQLTAASQKQQSFEICVQEIHQRQIELMQRIAMIAETATQQATLNTRILETMSGLKPSLEPEQPSAMEDRKHAPTKTTWFPSPAEVEQFRRQLQMPKEAAVGSR